MLEFSDSQLSEGELSERMALEEATIEFEKWQDLDGPGDVPPEGK